MLLFARLDIDTSSSIDVSRWGAMTGNRFIHNGKGEGKRVIRNETGRVSVVFSIELAYQRCRCTKAIISASRCKQR